MSMIGLPWLAAVLGAIIHALGATGQTCHIPVGTSALAANNQSAVRFVFSEITNNVDFLLPNLNVSQHVFTVSGCSPKLYLLSTSIANPNPELLRANLAGVTFSCIGPDAESDTLDGTIVKFLRNSLPFDEVIPNTWRSQMDNTIVLRLNFQKFPVPNSASYRCDLRQEVRTEVFVIPVEVKASFLLMKIGCPRASWGTDCSSPCGCLNSGECHTFEGQCLCPDGFTGSQCETDLSIVTTTNTPTTPSSTTETVESKTTQAATLSTTTVRTQPTSDSSNESTPTVTSKTQNTQSTRRNAVNITKTSASTSNALRNQTTATSTYTTAQTSSPSTTTINTAATTTKSPISTTTKQPSTSTTTKIPSTSTITKMPSTSTTRVLPHQTSSVISQTEKTTTSSTYATETTTATLSNTCHIPVGFSALAARDEDAVRFSFSPVTSNYELLIPRLDIAEHVYLVSDCRPSLFLLSTPMRNFSPFLYDVDLPGTGFICREVVSDANRRPAYVFGTVIKFLQKAAFSEVIPNSWRSLSDNTVILQLLFSEGFPQGNSATYRCNLDTEVELVGAKLEINVQASSTLTKVGCPRDRWGTDCSVPCRCVNGGECHTFEGQCLCPDGFTGSLCETDLKNPVETTTTTSRNTCHIPVGLSALAARDEDAVRFSFSPVTNNYQWLIPRLDVAEHIYLVSDCRPSLFLLSTPMRNFSPLLYDVDLLGKVFICIEVVSDANRRSAYVFGTVIKFLRKAAFSEVIPSSWRSLSDNTVILKLQFSEGFPQGDSATYRCNLKKDVNIWDSKFEINVQASSTLTKVGCPRDRWGTDCSVPCRCVNGGECHTFEGHCLCPDGFTGSLCQTDLNNPGRSSSTAPPSSAPPSTEPPSTAQPASGNTGEVKDNDGTSGFPVLLASHSWTLLLTLTGLFAKTVLN